MNLNSNTAEQVEYTNLVRVRINGELSTLGIVEYNLDLNSGTLKKLYDKYKTTENLPITLTIKGANLELFKAPKKN